MGGVEREDAAVAVALAEERDKTHELDQELVVAEPRAPLRQPVDDVAEIRLGDRVVRIRVIRLEPLDEPLQISRELRLRSLAPLRPAAAAEESREDEHGREGLPHARSDAAVREMLVTLK